MRADNDAFNHITNDCSICTYSIARPCWWRIPSPCACREVPDATANRIDECWRDETAPVTLLSNALVANRQSDRRQLPEQQEVAPRAAGAVRGTPTTIRAGTNAAASGCGSWRPDG